MCKPHKHSALIKAWADNPSIVLQCRPPKAGRLDYPWTDVGINEPILWSNDIEYRIKPEPKPDVVMYGRIGLTHPNLRSIILKTEWTFERSLTDNAIATFDGETNTIKSVEIIK